MPEARQESVFPQSERDLRALQDRHTRSHKWSPRQMTISNVPQATRSNDFESSPGLELEAESGRRRVSSCSVRQRG
jgi:hypothetical protein